MNRAGSWRTSGWSAGGRLREAEANRASRITHHLSPSLLFLGHDNYFALFHLNILKAPQHRHCGRLVG